MFSLFVHVFVYINKFWVPQTTWTSDFVFQHFNAFVFCSNHCYANKHSCKSSWSTHLCPSCACTVRSNTCGPQLQWNFWNQRKTGLTLFVIYQHLPLQLFGFGCRLHVASSRRVSDTGWTQAMLPVNCCIGLTATKGFFSKGSVSFSPLLNLRQSLRSTL